MFTLQYSFIFFYDVPIILIHRGTLMTEIFYLNVLRKFEKATRRNINKEQN